MADYAGDFPTICEYCGKEHLGCPKYPKRSQCKPNDLKKEIDKLRNKISAFKKAHENIFEED